MNGEYPGVLIIGGGVAGMAAAQLLSDFDISVHVAEKQDRLGGHAAMWACMATESCMNCGACMSAEMAKEVSARKNVAVHLATRVTGINRSEGGFEVTLAGGENFTVRKIITATGFQPFNPRRIRAYHTDTAKNVITTSGLNTLLRNEGLEKVLPGNAAPEFAFIQCVGSRNRKIGNDYCSQVCCRVAMRHANKLLHLYPDAGITVFYMDLQVIGKEIRAFYDSLSKKADLVQGVPAEIMENPETGRLRIITENRDDMTRMAREFDMVVLSVGMESAPGGQEIADLLGLSPNSWGFFNTDDASLAEDIHAAGCAATPRDILSSIQDGRNAAGKVLEDLGLAGSGKRGALFPVAVFGEGGQAVSVASALARRGCKTVLFGAETPEDNSGRLRSHGDANILGVSGTAGHFNIYHEFGGKRWSMACSAIVAAHEPDLALPDPGFSSDFVLEPEAFSRLISATPEKCPDTIAILLDFGRPAYKKWVRMALKDALRARKAGRQVSVIANKMLVHKADGQRLYDRARKAGVDFLRYEIPEDIRLEKTAQGVAVFLKEATIPSSVPIRLDADLLVLPPKIEAPADFPEKASVLRQKTDKEGFLQSPNVRHRLTGSPRKGIFFAGTCHDETDSDDLAAEIDEILTFLDSQPMGAAAADTGVAINERMCAQCLTCYRICPHGAIVLNEKMRPCIVADACFSCHLCVASCPARAIDTEIFPANVLAGRAEKDRVVVFACERSAYLAASEDNAIPGDICLVEIPCACRISTDIVLEALLKGASKVIIAGCHEGNCRSMEGAREAAASVRQVRAIPGLNEKKVVFAPVAANEPEKIKRIVSQE